MTDTACPADSAIYRGRFAPTPSGPLHLGSLLTALAGFLDARHARGRWLLRIDDLDHPRCPAGAADLILAQLEAHGLHWDESPRYQSQHLAEYQSCLSNLQNTGHVYSCHCTRAELARNGPHGADGPVYDGRCRTREFDAAGGTLRFRSGVGTLELDDDIQGVQRRDVASDIGDFVVRRRDGIIGYHLASVIDERAQRITDVVRGADLTGSSLSQLRLFQQFGWQAPRYRHLPILLDSSGRKLSKQNHAPAIEIHQASDNLWQCLRWLGQEPPIELRGATPAALLSWATPRWRRDRVPRTALHPVEQPG
jgi:glutamyl-Q tRNA(Asp) synthetase